MSAPALLPELAEADARGRLAEIYAALRERGGVPHVALIFRHLATLPGALDWAWAVLEPAWRSGRLQETAWAVAREAPTIRVGPIPPEALDLLGVDAAAVSEARAVLRAYNRANPENLLSVLCLLRRLEAAAPQPSAPRAALSDAVWSPPPALPPLPPMVAPQAIPGALLRLLERVGDPGAAGGPRVVPSLYRHLVHRPALLALWVTLLQPPLHSGEVDRAREAIERRMAEEADRLVESLPAPEPPSRAMQPALARFGGGVIARMIAVGAALEATLPS